MKFVCENCKAKYQIGDDKVAGKTLRMKCRRCGHMIQVSATVTESSVSKLNPTLPPPVEQAAAEPHASERPDVPDLGMNEATSTGDEESATVVRPSPFFLRQTGTSPAVRPPGGPRIVPPGRPSGRASSPPGAGGAPAAPVSLASRPPAGVPSIAGRGPSPLTASPRPGPVGLPRVPAAPARPGGPLAARAAAAVAAHPASVAPPSSVPLSTPPPSAGLSGGFSRAVAEAPAVPSHAPPTEDWYVGVGGVPLGPVRLSVIREKAAAGAVDGDSLVWREGFEEWQPLKTFPALLSIVDEARSTRTSRSLTPVPAPLTPPPPKPANGSGHRESLGGMGAAGGLGASVNGFGASGPTPAAGSAPGSGPGSIPTPATSVPFSLVTPAGSTPAGRGPDADPFGAPKSDKGASADVLGLGAMGALGSANAVPGGDVSPFARPSMPPPSVSAPPERKRGLHPMAWAFIAMCAAFGGVAAWAVFLRKPETIIIQNTPTATQNQGPNLPAGAAPPAPPTNLPSAVPTASAGPGPSSGSGPVALGPGKTAKPEGSSAPPSNFDPSGFSAGGPSSGPDANGGSKSGNGQLSQGEIEGVVTRNKPGITRRCWGPAYDARDANAGKSAKVNVSITVGPSGSVQSASASGGDHFPGLSSCIQGSVRGWQFPPSEGQTTVNIPFSFNQQ